MKFQFIGVGLYLGIKNDTDTSAEIQDLPI